MAEKKRKWQEDKSDEDSPTELKTALKEKSEASSERSIDDVALPREGRALLPPVDLLPIHQCKSVLLELISKNQVTYAIT